MKAIIDAKMKKRCFCSNRSYKIREAYIDQCSFPKLYSFLSSLQSYASQQFQNDQIRRKHFFGRNFPVNTRFVY